MNRPLVPFFIKKLDKKLLLNKPAIWSTRVHLVIWFSLLFTAALTLICFISVNDLKAYSMIHVWIGFVALAAFIGLVIWLIFLLRFNVFKRFGLQKTGDGIKTFAIFFICTLFIVLPTFIPPAIESVRANMAYGDDEIINDVNSMNEKICQLNYATLPKSWTADTFRLIPAIEHLDNTDAAVSTVEVIAPDQHIASPGENYHYVEGEELDEQLLQSDSTKEITDSFYIIYSCPQYAFVSAYQVSLNSDVPMNNSVNIYYSLIKNLKPFDVEQAEVELAALLKKYNYDGLFYRNYDYSTKQYSSVDNNVSYYTRINDKYNLNNVSSGISNISEKKYRWKWSNLDEYFRVLFYLAFYLALIVFIFRHTTVKTFFLTILAGVILFILSGLMVAFFANRHEEETIAGLFLFYYAAFFLYMLSINTANVRTAMKGISLNLVTLFTSLIPLVAVFFYYSANSIRASIDYNGVAYHQWLQTRNTRYLIAEIAGVVVFIILLEPLFKKLYRKWYALPEN